GEGDDEAGEEVTADVAEPVPVQALEEGRRRRGEWHDRVREELGARGGGHWTTFGRTWASARVGRGRRGRSGRRGRGAAAARTGWGAGRSRMGRLGRWLSMSEVPTGCLGATLVAGAAQGTA